jgi:glyoxylase-like metal-dependent hydrolase (beta-lactamase superfamily II)
LPWTVAALDQVEYRRAGSYLETFRMMKPSPRILMSCLVVALAAVAALVTGSAMANAPLSKLATPGWSRMTLGDFEVTSVSDGTVALPVDKLLTNITPAKVEAALARAYLKNPVETSVNTFVVNTGTKLVLIDAGAGSLFGPTLGKLITNLKAAGYQPDQIDEIYITHMHPDHVGGLTANGKPVFPNAIVRAAKAEGEQWLTQANLDKAPDAMKDFFKGAMASVNPYATAGKFKPFEGETELVPGIRAMPAVGHTSGHTTYVVQSKDQKLVVLGDMIHVGAVQFAEPSVTIQFDTDSKKAAAERKKVFADAAKQGYFLAIAHISFPGIGQLRAEGAGYRWLPVNFNANGATPAAK